MDDIKKGLGGIGKSSKDTEKNTKKLAGAFTGIGAVWTQLKVNVIQKAFDGLTGALMANQQVADTVETVMNAIGIVFTKIVDVIVKTYKSVSESTENFDALGRVMGNLLTLAITPLKLAFHGIKLAILAAQLAWKKSWLGGGGKDVERIKELTDNIKETKEDIKEVAVAAWESGKAIVKDFGEAIEEASNIGKVLAENFKEEFKDVTVETLLEQGKALMLAKKNYEMLGLVQARLIEQYDRDAEAQRQLRDDKRLTMD